MEPQRPSRSNLHYKSMRAKEELDAQLMKEQAQLAQPSHRMRSRNDALETARFLNAKEQAKQDMRIRRTEKGEAARGTWHQDDVTGKRAQQQQQQQRHSENNNLQKPSSFSN